MIIHEGPSLLTGEPVVVIVTGFRRRTRNEKTGDMLQSWILTRDTHPQEAVRTGADDSICGDCPLRGKKCYVKVYQAPSQVWKAYHRGVYPRYTSECRSQFCGRKLRIGSYGDPCAVPYSVWSELVRLTDDHVGYTHQWRQRRFWRFRRLVMASVETLSDAELARSRGWRTFRVARPDEGLTRGEFICPASPEGGWRKTCAECMACDGAGRNARRASVVIGAHGSAAVMRSWRASFDV